MAHSLRAFNHVSTDQPGFTLLRMPERDQEKAPPERGADKALGAVRLGPHKAPPV